MKQSSKRSKTGGAAQNFTEEVIEVILQTCLGLSIFFCKLTEQVSQAEAPNWQEYVLEAGDRLMADTE